MVETKQVWINGKTYNCDVIFKDERKNSASFLAAVKSVEKINDF